MYVYMLIVHGPLAEAVDGVAPDDLQQLQEQNAWCTFYVYKIERERGHKNTWDRESDTEPHDPRICYYYTHHRSCPRTGPQSRGSPSA